MNTQEVQIPLEMYRPELFLNDGPDWEIDENQETEDIQPLHTHIRRYWYYKKEPLSVPSDLLH